MLNASNDYLLLVITGFSLLLLLFLTIGYRSLSQENTQLRLAIARLTRHPSVTREQLRLVPDEFTLLTEHEAAALLADPQQPTLPGFDQHTAQALRLANGR